MSHTLRVLLVEDNADAVDLIRESLPETGPASFQVESCPHLAAALARLAAGGIDVVLLDLGLPDSQGLDTFRRLRAAAPDLPTIVLTGHDDLEMAIAAMRDGAQDYLVKGHVDGNLLARAARYAVERVRAEAVLRESERRLQEAQRLGRIGHWELEPATGTLHWSDLVFAIFERDPKLGPPTPPEEAAYYSPEDAARLRQCAARALATGEPYEIDVRVKLPGGRLADVVALGAPITDVYGRTTGLAGTIQDITTRKRAEAALVESARTFKIIFDSVTDGILLADVETTRFTTANQAICRMLGYTEEQLLALALADIHTEADLPHVREQFERLARGDLTLVLDLPVKRKDGSVFFADISSAPVELDGRTHLIGVFRDTTERKLSEQALLRTEEQLRQAQKMEAVGRLAGGVAHDFNNLLSVILSNCSFALETLKADDPMREDITDIKEAGERAANLTRQLLSFSRRQILEPRVLDLNGLIRDLNKMLPRLLGEDIAIVLALAPSLGLVRADPGQLEQVLVNLAVNARDAMPNGGKLLVETADVELDEAYVRRHATGAVGPFVQITVSDTGCGMDQETQARIFEPFFTTKEKGQGTGLGLSTVYGIVRQSDGFISVSSEPGRGTTFELYLPRLTSAEQPWRPAAAPAAPRGGDETILLVEDSAPVRAAAARALANLGYRVLEADGIEPARRAAASPEPINLLLTDMVMPGGSGREVAAAVKAAHPAVKVLYMSGYTDNVILPHGALEPGEAFVQKPFTPDVLSRKVRAVLDGEGNSST